MLFILSSYGITIQSLVHTVGQIYFAVAKLLKKAKFSFREHLYLQIKDSMKCSMMKGLSLKSDLKRMVKAF